MPWENFAECPQADTADSNKEFQKRLLLWFHTPHNRPILDLLKHLPLQTLVRIHLADGMLHIDAVEPPRRSEILPYGLGGWVDARTMSRVPDPLKPHAIPGSSDWTPQTTPAEPRAVAFFTVSDLDLNPMSFSFGKRVDTRLRRVMGVRLSDLVDTSRFRMHANYEVTMLEYEHLQGKDEIQY